MNKFSPLRAAGAALVLGGVAFAQSGPFDATIDYSTHWQPMHRGVTAAFSGPGIFGFINGDPGNFAGPGDAIRRCYGVDSTQGGRNWMSGVGPGFLSDPGDYDNTWFKIAQGYAGANAIQGVDVGLVSVSSAADSDTTGDACFSPFFFLGTGHHSVSAAAIIGLIGGTTLPFPTVWEVGFQWVGGTPSTFIGAQGPVSFGGPGATSCPANVIYEVQGPLNGGPTDNQYYLASTIETTGQGCNPGSGTNTGTGGVTNGNANRGFGLFGVQAETSNVISHTRIFAFSAAGGGVASTGVFVNTQGDTEFNGHIAFKTPFLWGVKSPSTVSVGKAGIPVRIGDDGAGGADILASSPATPAGFCFPGPAAGECFDFRVVDHLSGAQGPRGSDIYWKTTNASVVPSAARVANPQPPVGCIPIFYSAAYLWSATGSALVKDGAQWSDLWPGGPRPGSFLWGPVFTTRDGTQRRTAELDTLTLALLSYTNYSFGTTFTGADDVFLDGTVPDGSGSHSTLWEGMFSPIISGVSGMTGAVKPIVYTAAPGFCGLRLSINGHSLNLCFDTGTGTVVNQTYEHANGLTVNLQ